MNTKLKELNPNSRLWIYQANRKISEEESGQIENHLKDFIANWNAHGRALTADFEIINQRFVLLAVDEEKANATGCSIDSSVKEMKEIGKELNLDFFNRLQVLITNDNELKEIHYSEKENFKGWKMYDNTITKVSEIENDWLKTI